MASKNKARCSFELGHVVDIALEGSIVDVGAIVVKVWHHWLVHGTIPLDVSWSSVPVSIDVLVVLMEDWVLTSPPFAVCIWNWWALWQDAADVPIEEVWVVAQCLHVEGVIVQHNRAVAVETTANSSDNEVHDIEVGDPATCVEILDWQFTNEPQAESNSELGASGVIGKVEVRSVHWPCHFFHFASWEP